MLLSLSAYVAKPLCLRNSQCGSQGHANALAQAADVQRRRMALACLTEPWVADSDPWYC